MRMWSPARACSMGISVSMPFSTLKTLLGLNAISFSMADFVFAMAIDSSMVERLNRKNRAAASCVRCIAIAPTAATIMRTFTSSSRFLRDSHADSNA